MTQIINLPPPDPNSPVVTRVVSVPPIDMTGPDQRPVKTITWVLGGMHPMIADCRVVRMYVDRGGVDVYSVPIKGGTEGTRHHIPQHLIRLVEEGMSIEVLADEIALAESGDDDEIEGEEEGENVEVVQQPPTPPPNGQISS